MSKRTVPKSLKFFLFPLASTMLSPDSLYGPPIWLKVAKHLLRYLLVRNESIQDILHGSLRGNGSEVKRATRNHGWHDEWVVRHGLESIQVRSRRRTALRVLQLVPGPQQSRYIQVKGY